MSEIVVKAADINRVSRVVFRALAHELKLPKSGDMTEEQSALFLAAVVRCLILYASFSTQPIALAQQIAEEIRRGVATELIR